MGVVMNRVHINLIVYSLLAVAALQACGVFTPHVDVGGTGSVSVGGTGTIQVEFNLSQITLFFQQQCTEQLGVGATQAQIASCVTTSTAGFLNFLSGLGAITNPTPSPSP